MDRARTRTRTRTRTRIRRGTPKVIQQYLPSRVSEFSGRPSSTVSPLQYGNHEITTNLDSRVKYRATVPVTGCYEVEGLGRPPQVTGSGTAAALWRPSVIDPSPIKISCRIADTAVRTGVFRGCGGRQSDRVRRACRRHFLPLLQMISGSCSQYLRIIGGLLHCFLKVPSMKI